MKSELLKALRKTHGLTQSKMAGLLQMPDQGAYCRRENGQYQFKLNELCLMAEILNMDVSDVNATFFDNKLKDRDKV
jgi:transcriptional regulator with XRE-family HTH domain